MGPEITAYPNGHDSTGIPEEPARQPTPNIQIIRAGGDVPESPTLEMPGPAATEVPGRPITMEELYPSIENVSPELNSAVHLLSLCLEYADQALEAHRENDLIDADDAVQRIQGILPELFCCRSLGDGFGIVINGLMCAFQNLAGVPLQREQIEKIRLTLMRLRTEPFLRAEDAVSMINALDDVELVVEPAEFKYLADLLDE